MADQNPASKSANKKVDTVRLQTMSRAFIQSASLFAAIDLGLFTAISQGHNTPETFAKQASISALNAERIMAMAAASGLTLWNQDHYENADDAEQYLVEGNKGYAADWLTFARPGWKNWGVLTDKLRNDTPAQVLGKEDANRTVDQARTYHRATSSVGFGSGRRFNKQVDLSKRFKMMDLGGGSGAYSIVAAKANPQLSAVVFDLPAVAQVTQEFIDEHKVGDQVTAQGGDFTKDAFPAGCDVALMASNLPQYNREIIAGVIDKAFAALVPGGEMHLIGEMLDDDRAGPMDAAVWALFEALSNSTGLAHTRGDCVSYFERAGFVDVQVHEFIPNILVRVTGTKPIEG